MTAERLLVIDKLVCVFQKVLISWDLCALHSLEFSQNGARNTKHPVSSSSTYGEKRADRFELTVTQVQSLFTTVASR